MRLEFLVVTNKEMFEYTADHLLLTYQKMLELNLANRHWYGFQANHAHKSRRRSNFRAVINDIRLLREMVRQNQENHSVVWKRDYSADGFVLMRVI